MARQRIVITGIGGLCALGTDVPAIWQRDARRPLGASARSRRFTLHDLKVRIGAEIKQLPDARHRPQAARDDGPFQPAGGASRRGEALRAAGLSIVDAAEQPTASARSSAPASTAPRPSTTDYRQVFRRRARRASASSPCRKIMPGAPAGQVSMAYRPARPGLRRHLGLRLVQPRLRRGRRPDCGSAAPTSCWPAAPTRRWSSAC